MPNASSIRLPEAKVRGSRVAAVATAGRLSTLIIIHNLLSRRPAPPHLIAVVTNKLAGDSTPTILSFRAKVRVRDRAHPRTRPKVDNVAVKWVWRLMLLLLGVVFSITPVHCMDLTDYDTLYRDLVHDGQFIVDHLPAVAANYFLLDNNDEY